MSQEKTLTPTPAKEDHVEVLVIGSGTGMLAALAANEAGLNTLVIEKSSYVGGSTAMSGGAFWIPANPVLQENGARDSLERAREYLHHLVGDVADAARWQAYLDNGEATVELLQRATDLEFLWAKGYADYHPQVKGGSAVGRSVESRPFNARVLGDELDRLHPPAMAAPIPMPITSPDYRWMNLMSKVPSKGVVKTSQRMLQGLGGLAIGREYLAGGQALAAGLYAGVLKAGIPVWTETELVELVTDNGRVSGAIVKQHGKHFTITASEGVILASGGFDHNYQMRHEHQSPNVGEYTMAHDGNTGDAIQIAQQIGADVAFMDQAWWFPAVAPIGDERPGIMLAERSLPGSFIVDASGNRFINESCDYMTFGQEVLRREQDGDPVGQIWIVFDQEYRNSYVFSGSVFPRMKLPDEWYEAGIAQTADTPAELAQAMGIPTAEFEHTIHRFNVMAAAGRDDDFQRGDTAYDRYYGDPTIAPNPNLRPLSGKLYAVKMVLSDLGTCGGLKADDKARVLRTDGSVIEGLYAIGNTAGNAFGNRYPGAGATIGQGLVFGLIAAQHAAGR